MNLKPKKISNGFLPVEEPDPLDGAWGRINPVANASIVVRFFSMGSRTQKTHSYPYRTISSWHWTKTEHQEVLLIATSGDTIAVKGKALDRIVDALAQGKLESLRETAADFQIGEEASIQVSSITIDKE